MTELLERAERQARDLEDEGRWDFVEFDAAAKVIRDLMAECAGWEASFDLYHRASRDLMRAYKDAHPDVPADVWPDAGAVCAWAAAELRRR